MKRTSTEKGKRKKEEINQKETLEGEEKIE